MGIRRFPAVPAADEVISVVCSCFLEAWYNPTADTRCSQLYDET